jgi:16S rRNA A1518/A1519 N6-dimethyltransferase RsmA/KsgA/DIM1 with predicted DNA glycosylase/AP lyase activity
VATPLLKRFIDAREHILDVTIMLQKEVAERIRAKAGSSDYGPLSLLIQYYATPVWGFTVPPGAFTPRPKVDSAVIRLEWKPGVPMRRISRTSCIARFLHDARSSSTISLRFFQTAVVKTFSPHERREGCSGRASRNAHDRAVPACV